MKQFKTKLKYDFAEALANTISQVMLAIVEPDQDEQLFLAGIAEVKLRIEMKLLRYRPKFQITLSPVQALSLRMLYTDYVQGDTDYTGNKLRMIANDIHQHYS